MLHNDPDPPAGEECHWRSEAGLSERCVERQRPDHTRHHNHDGSHQFPDGEARHRPVARRMPAADQVALQEPTWHQLENATTGLYGTGVCKGIERTEFILKEKGE